MSDRIDSRAFPPFDRRFLDGAEDFTVIGGGALGGKAHGLAFIRQILARELPAGTFRETEISIPRLTVLATDTFEQFMAANGLYEVALSGTADERIAHAFQRGELPTTVLGDLRALIGQMHTPLAVRSSSLLEDALAHPFAGTYATKMIPNNQADVATRFQRLVEAIKFVWASTFFRDAQQYMRSIGQDPRGERMAVIIQEVVGQRFGERFYPSVAAVLRSHNFYPMGPAAPADGVALLALGLGKTIVDGGVCWSYCPRYPEHRPPFGSLREMVANTQTRLWAVHMGPPPPWDPTREDEYLVEADLNAAEYDGTLRWVASTYDPESDRLVLGTGRPGPRVLTFAPLLELDDVPLNRVIAALLDCCKRALNAEVEIELAVTLDRQHGRPMRVGFLQLRPMLVSDERVDVSEAELANPRALLASARVLGNGMLEGLTDVVYVRPQGFEARHTPAIAAELAELNARLVAEGRTCVLIGFGRWGSSDSWLGIPVTWPQISAARVLVEATLPEMNVEPSQGTHLFHNMTSFRVQYFTVHHSGPYRIDWAWLDGLPAVAETCRVRHVRSPIPLTARVDGRTQRGVVMR